MRIAGGAVAATVMLLVAPLPASAGGPTSVLLVSPGRQATASFYTSDEGYARLTALLVQNPTSDPAAPNLDGDQASDAVNVTWLIHDVQIWRIDRIFTDAAGGPWVETRMVQDGKNPFDQSGIVHRPSDGKDLITLLSAMRLLGSSPVEAFAGAKAPAEVPAATSPAVSAPAGEQVADLNWLWLVIGAAAGGILVIGFRPLVRRLRPN